MLARFFSSVIAIVFILAAATASAETVRGRVVDPAARPVARAQILVLQRGAVIATATTVADGGFGPLLLPPGEYEIVVAAKGLRSTPQRLVLTTGKDIDLPISLTLAGVTESVVVSAAQVDLPLSRATESVTVIDRIDLDLRQVQTVGDALRAVPGFGVVTSGTRGGVTSIFPRGGESNYTLVLVDGIPQNTFGNDFDAAHLNTADVDRIEVVRGPQSALFGGGAIGGVVQVITRHGGPLRTQALFEGGGYGSSREAASAAASRDGWRWGLGVDRLHTDGDTRVFPSTPGPVSNSFYNRLAGSGSIGWSDRPSRAVRLDVRLGKTDRGAPGPYGSDPLDLFNPFGGIDRLSHGTTRTSEVGVSATLGGGSIRQRVQTTWARLDSEFFSQFDLTHPSNNDTRRTTGRYQADFGPGSVPLSAGAEILHERADNTFITGGPAASPLPVNRLVSGLFVEGRPSFGNRGFLTLGLRLERIQRDALTGDPAGFSGRPALGQDVVWSANPKASIAWLLSRPDARNWTRIRAGAGTGIRPPNGFELAYTNNPGLKPERSRSVDAGVEQALMGSALAVDATFFANRYEDLIVTVGSSFTGASKYRTDNLANAESRGLELGASWRGPRGVSARAAWTMLHTEVLGADGAPTLPTKAIYKVGDALVRRPRQQGALQIDWSTARATAFVAVNGRGRMPDVEPNLASQVFTNPGHTLLAVGGSLRLVRGIELFGRIENALDKRYEEALGYPALGRAAWLGIRVAAGR